MRRWEFSVSIDPQATIPVFVQIARALAGDIRRGRLRPDDLMPGTRSLARTLRVHRNTVIAAYDELCAEGWVSTVRGRGTFVAKVLPDPRPRRFAAVLDPKTLSGATAFDLGPAILADCCGAALDATFNLSGWPDMRLLPVEALARAWRRAIQRRGRQALAYGPSSGHPRLRAALASMLTATRGLVVDESRVLITRGTQGALAVIAHGILNNGDLVAVENPGYLKARQIFAMRGARPIPFRVDEYGLCVDELAAFVDRQPIRAVFVTPHHQCPTTVTLSPARRLQLLELAKRHRFAIIEDDYDHEFHYDGRPLLPLASADPSGSVIYVGSLSKTLAPGLRLGYVVATPAVIQHLTEYRSLLDIQGDHVLESAVAELIEEGEVQRHVHRARRIYHSRRDAMVALMARELGDAVHVTVPVGGTTLWTRVSPGIHVEQWRQHAAARGVIFDTGERFSFDAEPLPYALIGFARHHEAELADAVRLLAAALPLGGGSRTEVSRTRQPSSAA